MNYGLSDFKRREIFSKEKKHSRKSTSCCLSLLDSQIGALDAVEVFICGLNSFTSRVFHDSNSNNFGK
jgi:hypothetical protein